MKLTRKRNRCLFGFFFDSKPFRRWIERSRTIYNNELMTFVFQTETTSRKSTGETGHSFQKVQFNDQRDFFSVRFSFFFIGHWNNFLTCYSSAAKRNEEKKLNFSFKSVKMGDDDLNQQISFVYVKWIQIFFYSFSFFFFSIDQTPSSSRFLDSLSYPHFLSMAILVMFGCSFFFYKITHTHTNNSAAPFKKKKRKKLCRHLDPLAPSLLYQ